MTRSRLMTAVYLLGKRRAEAKARRERDALADQFEAYNQTIDRELRSLKQEVARTHMIDDAIVAERDETRWLH